MKIRQMEGELMIYADVKAHTTKLTVAFRNFPEST